jgi:hypothetical protein
VSAVQEEKHESLRMNGSKEKAFSILTMPWVDTASVGRMAARNQRLSPEFRDLMPRVGSTIVRAKCETITHGTDASRVLLQRQSALFCDSPSSNPRPMNRDGMEFAKSKTDPQAQSNSLIKLVSFYPCGGLIRSSQTQWVVFNPCLDYSRST